jgi:TRAP-type C4-dicarboxylate transport system permease small subunit
MTEPLARSGVRDALIVVVRSIRFVSLICAGIAAVIMAGLILLQVFDVLVRNVTGASAVRGIAEYVSVGLVFVTFLSIAHAEQVGAHVRTPVLISRLPRRVGVTLRGVALVAAALVIWALAWATFGKALDAFESSEVFPGVARVPSWAARFAIPLGAFLLGIELVARALLLDGEDEDDELPILSGEQFP